MTTRPNEARAALEMMGINAPPEAVASELYGWLAAAAFGAMIDHDHGAERAMMMGHHEFAEAFGSQLAVAAGGSPPDAWGMALTLLGFAIPTPAIADPIQTSAAPYAALRLAAACCTLMANPDDPRAETAIATVVDVAGRLGALVDPSHLITSARNP